MSVNRVIVASILVAAAGLSGCVSTRNALGLTKVTPDEFRVVTKAPLVVPPDFALRPPAPGKPRPQELQPESAARVALIGQRAAEQRSTGITVAAEAEKRAAVDRGFSLGAVDYISKPAAPEVVVAKVRSILSKAARQRSEA